MLAAALPSQQQKLPARPLGPVSLDVEGQQQQQPLPGGVTVEEIESYLTTTLTSIQRNVLRFSLASEIPFPTRRNGERPVLVDDEDGGGVLAVDMGFGKTLSMLVLVLRDKLLAQRAGYKSAREFKTLVIGAPALYSVWQAQIHEHFKKGVLTMVQHSESKDPEKALVNAQADIVFCTYQRIQLDMKQHLPSDALRELLAKTSINSLRTREAYSRNAYMNQKLDHRSRLVRHPITRRGVHGTRWWRIIIDEADSLRNLKSKRFRAVLGLAAYNRWWVTGTPLNNSFSDIVAAMLFLRDAHVCLEQALLPDPRCILKKIKSDQEKRARQSFERRAYVLTKQMVIEDYPELIAADPRLKYLTAPVYMFQFADKFATEEERIVYKRMQDELVSLLRELRNRNVTMNNTAVSTPVPAAAAAAAAAVAPDEDEEAEINNEHVLAYENQDEMDEDMARVERELESAANKKPTPRPAAAPAPNNNNNSILNAAIESVVRSSNPAWSARATVNYFYLRCMQASVMSSFADKSLAKDPNPAFHSSSTKLRMLGMWLQERIPKDDKVVIFSQWTTVLRAAKESLGRIGIKCADFNGELKEHERVAQLKMFNEDPECRVLLSQSRVGGIGQTFTAANWVIFLNPWFNPQLERQALSRIYRMGQKKTCYVVWLITCGTIEEIIRGNASGKMKRAEELLLSVDRQYPKVAEIYAQLAQLVMGRFEPRDGWRDYQQRELFRDKFAYQPPATEQRDYAVMPYRDYERLVAPTGERNQNNKRPLEIAPSDRRQHVSRIKLEIPTGKRSVMCLLSYAAYRYSGILPRFGVFWRVPSLPEHPRSESVIFDWNRACIELCTRTVMMLRELMEPKRDARGKPSVPPTVVQSVELLRNAEVPSIELYSATQLMERESHLTGDYNELSLISSSVVPIGKGGANLLNQSLCFRQPLDPSTTLAFLPCLQCKRFIDHQNMAYGRVHAYDVVTPPTLMEDAFAPHWQLMKSAALMHGFESDDDKVELVIRNHSHEDYLAYTKTLVLPAMATGSSALLTRALLSFHWAPSPSRETEEAKALEELLPSDEQADLRIANGVVRRVYSAWHTSPEFGDERVVAIASALLLIVDGKVTAAFACGVSVDSALPENVRGPAAEKLAELLVQRDIMCDISELYDRYKMPEVTTRKGIAARPVLHLRAVSPEIVKVLSAQTDVVVKDGVHDIHKGLCTRSEPLFDTADLARQTGTYFNATAVWESLDN